ncbi:MAG: ornithine cyclodeaminase family protein [Desulfovibrio aminophilus]|jgi:ornithine cyclodeaminase/alanine dehydrogenase|uniref:ornithine cyclodeaminase family protein n=1 Tax=Desulfovibrio aminophilus TaxID=81425 RepID=UPI002A396C68|nr:ornithine cyclodeaminase family protein [Desulfovibrionaceae bacterium]
MSFDVLWLSRADLDSLGLGMPAIMDAVEQGFACLGRGEAEMPAKIGIHPRHDCFIHAMPCWIGGAVDRCGIKCVSGYPPNQKKGLPYITGVMVLIDPETGLTQAVMDAGWVTAWRTGAASGVYAKHFGDPDSEVVSVIGLGVQGRVNLLAFKEVFPKIKQVRCFDPVAGQPERFLKDMGSELPRAEFVVCADAKSCVADADVVVTCTPIVEKPERFVHRAWLKEKVLAVSVDYDSAFAEDVMAATPCFVCDNANQYLWTRDQGVYFQNGYPDKTAVYADMGQICAGKKPGVRDGLRAAVLMGIASHDVMTASLAFDLARAKGLGSVVQL